MAESCVAMEILGLARHILGNEDEPHGIEEKGEY